MGRQSRQEQFRWRIIRINDLVVPAVLVDAALVALVGAVPVDLADAALVDPVVLVVLAVAVDVLAVVLVARVVVEAVTRLPICTRT